MYGSPGKCSSNLLLQCPSLPRHYEFCVQSFFPPVQPQPFWCNLVLTEQWGAIPPFPSSSALSHGKMVSLYPAKAKTIKFFCPFLVFLVVQHDPHSIPGLLSHISGAKFPCWSPGLPMPTYLSSTLQLWGTSLDSSLPVTLQVIGMLESSLMDSSKQFLAFMGFHLGLASLPAHQLLLAKLPLCPFCIGHSMCHNKYEV